MKTAITENHPLEFSEKHVSTSTLCFAVFVVKPDGDREISICINFPKNDKKYLL